MRLLPAIFLVVVLVSHAPFVDLPFFWDEVGQFIPASLDLFHSGALVPHSVTPNAHPPGLMAYLALIWSIAGYSVTATRLAMLLLAGVSVVVVFRLARKLGAPGAFVALLLCCSPVFYAQAMLAQLDMPAMLFTLLATLLFLEERFLFSAAVCTVLVLVKETSVVTPMLFGFWLLSERRSREACYFLLPAAALGSWLLLLKHDTGHLFGSAEFTYYNLTYMLHPVRMGVALGKRIYHLFWENLHWIGALGLLYGWLRAGVFKSRGWRIVWTLVALHVLLFSILGGAMLERYLLPVTPMVYIGMVAGWSAMASPWRVVGPVAFIVAVGACNFWNPPYPFPLENNLAFTDFVRLQQSAASFLEQNYPAREVSTAWPFSAALSHPEFGYATAPHRVREILDFSESSVSTLQGSPVDVLVLYSRQWDPPDNPLHDAIIGTLWRRYFSYEPQVSSEEVDRKFQLKMVRSWTRRGQWIEIHARY